MSDWATLQTNPAASVAPDPPQQLTCPHKFVTTNSFTVEWGAGNGRGNAITSYIVCLDDGAGGALEIVYRGPKRSYQAKGKASGRTYGMTVQAVTAYGVSQPSEVQTVTTISEEEIEAEEREQQEQRQRRREQKLKKKKTVEQRREIQKEVKQERKEVKHEMRLIQKVQRYWKLIIIVLLALGVYLLMNRKAPKRRRWHGVED